MSPVAHGFMQSFPQQHHPGSHSLSFSTPLGPLSPYGSSQYSSLPVSLCVITLTHPPTHSPAHSSTHPLTHMPIHSPPTCPLTHSSTHSPTHSLTHPLILWLFIHSSICRLWHQGTPHHLHHLHSIPRPPNPHSSMVPHNSECPLRGQSLDLWGKSLHHPLNQPRW